MDLNKLIRQIDLFVNEEIINDFISQHKNAIEKFIAERWSEYLQNLDAEKVEPRIVDDSKPTEIKNSEENKTNADVQRDNKIFEEDKENKNVILERQTSKENPKEQDTEMCNIPSEESIKIEGLKAENPIETAPSQAEHKLPENSNNSPIEDNKNSDSSAKKSLREVQIKRIHFVVPNGKVNAEYHFSFDLKKHFPEISTIKTIKGLKEIGLEFDPEAQEIRGMPTKSGDHKIVIELKLKDWEEGKPETIDNEIIIIINPDPRSLWNNIPTPQDIEYYKPDSDKAYINVSSHNRIDELNLGHKNMVAASQRGRSHAHEGIPRDDDFSLLFDKKTEWYIMVVADGAGSAKYSRKGAQIACQTVIDVCEKQILDGKEDFEKSILSFSKEKTEENRKKVGDILYGTVGNAAFMASKAIHTTATQKGRPIKDYSTTLLVSICKKFEFGWFVGAFWVGDGGIGIYTKDADFLKILGEPDGGEFAGQTRFLTMAEIVEPKEIYRRLRFDIIEDFTALILMSDGVTDAKFETDANLNDVHRWHNLWNDLTNNIDFSEKNNILADQLLEWLDFWSPGNHDDRTIAILF